MSWASVPSAARARLRAAVLERDGHRCQLRLDGCTAIATQADHIRSRELAGDGLDNLRAACATCNTKRGKPGRGDPAPRPSRWV